MITLDPVSTHPTTDLVAAPDMGRGVVTGATLDSRIRYAEVLSHAGLVPASYQGKPANVLYAVETGTMLGIHPIAALNGINVIQGKPTISPALMTALVRRAGHKVRVTVTGTVRAEDISATCEVIRHDDPTFTYRAAWDVDRAKRAGLWGGKGAWSNYPEAMLKARAISEVCREAAEDALCGISYTGEELGAAVDEQGQVIDGSREQRQEAPVRPAAPPAAVVPALDPDAVREAILGASSRDELKARLMGVGAADPKAGWHRGDLEALTVADTDGTEVSGWDLFAARWMDLDPALAQVVDAEVVEDDTATPDTSGGAQHREAPVKADPARRHPAMAAAMATVRAHATHTDDTEEN